MEFSVLSMSGMAVGWSCYSYEYTMDGITAGAMLSATTLGEGDIY